MIDHKAFRAEVKKQLTLRGWTYRNLVKETGYKYGTIERFMGGYDNNRPQSEAVARAIAKALDIPEHMAT